ncbi:MAG: tetratricopeptide repeat protein [Alphaproteobacteria bacterium]|nr:tetratricopeptide repeat protein [Alphaproteobacteria bacterium]
MNGRGGATGLWRRPAAAVLPGLLLVAISGIYAVAQHLPAVEADHYARCMDAARRDPAAAWENARSWHDSGGGHPADHCAAVALIGLKRYAEAGKRLDQLADAMTKAPPELRAEVLDQAGQAWLLAGDPARAEGSLTAALATLPADPDLLIDRAETYAAQKRYREAIADLDEALARSPGRADALVFRASAYRASEQLAAALRDVEAALRLAPDDADALLERGNIRRLEGDAAGAGADWRRIGQLAPNSPADAAAKDNLAKLDGTAPPAAAKKPVLKKPPLTQP